jgi:DNA-binding Lrp family transcriptional regulator
LKRWESFQEWIIQYQKALDKTNAKIIEGLQHYGPRNIKSLAKSINVPDTTVRFRIKQLIERHLLLVTANLDFTKLGLARVFLMAESPLGLQDSLHKVIEFTGYWKYIARCFGKFDGFIAYFAFPHRYRQEAQEYLEEAERLGILSHHLFFWITNSYFPHVGFEWYDFKRKSWKFRWDEWIEEIIKSPEELPETIKEPKNYGVLVDEQDLLILKEMEKDAMQDFRKLASVARITPQSVHFRWHNHVIKRKLILQYTTSFNPYPPQVSDFYSFIIEFEGERSLAKFCNASKRKPFIISYAKVIGQNCLVLGVYVLKSEFPNLIKTLNSLHADGIIKSFVYVMLDIMSHERQTVSYEFFKDGEWSYERNRKLEELKEIAGKLGR